MIKMMIILNKAIVNYIWLENNIDNYYIFYTFIETALKKFTLTYSYKDLLLYCAKLRLYMAFYKMQINSCNITAHHILKKLGRFDFTKILLYCAKLRPYEKQKSKRGIFSALVLGFIDLAFEGISSFLHQKRHNALKKAVKAMSISTDIHRKKINAFRKHFNYGQNL